MEFGLGLMALSRLDDESRNPARQGDYHLVDGA